QVFSQHFPFAGARQAAAQSSQDAPRPPHGPGAPGAAPGGQDRRHAPARDPEVVDRFAVVRGAHAHPRAFEGCAPPSEVRSHAGQRTRGDGSHGAEPRRGHGVKTGAGPDWSSEVTRSQRSSEMSSTEWVASRVWKSYSRARPSSSEMTRCWYRM